MNFARMSMNDNMKIVKGDISLNFGILWNTFNPLIIVYGLTILFGLGLRGSGDGLLRPEFFVFVILSWFNFLNIIQALLTEDLEQDFYKNKDFGNLFVVSIASVLTSLIQSTGKFILTILIVLFLGYEIKMLIILTSFYLTCSYGVLLAILIKFLILNNKLLINIMNYLFTALFFVSNVIFPISIFPSKIQEYFFFNPLVHINEFVREAYLETYGGLVDMSYPLYFLIPLILIILFLFLSRLNSILPRL